MYLIQADGRELLCVPRLLAAQEHYMGQTIEGLTRKYVEQLNMYIRMRLHVYLPALLKAEMNL